MAASDIKPRESVIECRRLVKNFVDAGISVEVLKNVSLHAGRGQRIAIVGASGSGKSTLLHLLGGLDQPTQGEVHVCGRNINALNDADRGRLRNEAIGFVYQFHHLLPEFTALENVAMPLLIRRMNMGDATEKAAELLRRVGLEKRMLHKPGELSGGEKQRAAVARALVTSPAIVLADEPTGNLDAQNGEHVYELMLELNAEYGTSLLVVTHDRSLADRMDTVWELEEGELRSR
ncbi:MAG: lipoprotein-releasing ABC transporter ATP-binding protein LolD [Gammaproteobacteria bacterium]|nr:lipoprotein-releasing ABC transporter ATP-binding protein LolD [Gammaproteobacteria bacterium]